MTSSIPTLTGKSIDFRNPQYDQIDILDIAYGLAGKYRFSGQTDPRLSVAQHSWLVSKVCEPPDAMRGLVHDAHEYVVHDMVTPLKSLDEMDGYRIVEARHERAVMMAFGIPFDDPASVKSRRRVKHWDLIVLATEARDLPQIAGKIRGSKLPAPLTEPLKVWKSPLYCEFMYLHRFGELGFANLDPDGRSRVIDRINELKRKIWRDGEADRGAAAVDGSAVPASDAEKQIERQNSCEGPQEDAVCGESQVPPEQSP